MKAQEVELALEEVEKAGEEQAKFGKCLGQKLLWFHYLSDSTEFIIVHRLYVIRIERCCILAQFQRLCCGRGKPRKENVDTQSSCVRLDQAL